MTIRIGILGFAHGHVNSYCSQWMSKPDFGVTVQAGWDHDGERLEKAVAAFAVDSCSSAEELLARDDLTAVVIAAETALHAELVEKAAESGKAIVLQKPMALTMAEADRIVEAVERAGVPFTMAWQMRADPQLIKIKELIEDGTIGRVFMVRRRHGLSFCLTNGAGSTWHLDPKWNRDIWADDSSHPIDCVQWLFGLPESVTSELMTLHNSDVPMDNGIAVFRYPNGPLVEVNCCFVNWAAENTMEVIGDKGSIVQNFGDQPSCDVPRPEGACGLKWYLNETGEWTESTLPTPKSHGERIEALAAPLAAFLQGERPAIATAEEGRNSLQMVLACYVSSREGRRVAMTDKEIAQV